eukprot:COSAG04_NODE_2150_length_4685_cov_7.818975_6_plen_114_part_00
MFVILQRPCSGCQNGRAAMLQHTHTGWAGAKYLGEMDTRPFSSTGTCCTCRDQPRYTTTSFLSPGLCFLREGQKRHQRKKKSQSGQCFTHFLPYEAVGFVNRSIVTSLQARVV